MSRTVFLSHIHEERQLALIIKEALEDEFSGFVDIFVSSDGYSIPAGSHFLSRIEKGLKECSAALFLISPKSVNRNWINFELGAVWIRNKMDEPIHHPEIPAIPFCHSGMELSKLPQPINNLNAIQANTKDHLESAFRSIQAAVGGKGTLKTDFVILSNKIIEFEKRYTIGDILNKFVKLFTKDPTLIYTLISQHPHAERVEIGLGEIENDSLKLLQENIQGIEDFVKILVKPIGLRIDNTGARNLSNVVIQFDSEIMKEYRDLILK